MGLGLSPAADGRSLIYPRWGADEHGTVHMVDIASGQDRVLPVDGMALGVIESNRSYLSPDGSQILFDRYEADGDHWAVAPVAGGPPVSIGPEWPDGREGIFTEAFWSPDGRRSSRITRPSQVTMSSGSSTRPGSERTGDYLSK